MAEKKTNHPTENDENAGPGPVDPQAINEELRIIRTVEKETHAEKVLSLEKVMTEQVFDARMDIWNVQTDKNRYWVITNPAGLYSQTQFPSFDYALTFHIGLAYRTASNQQSEAAETEQDQLAVVWRRWEQAGAALARAEEVEEFQAVGILCRECLLALVKAIVTDELIPAARDRPKAADFISWSEWIVDSIVSEPGAEEIRAYLKTTAKAAWQLVNGLALADNATKSDGHMAVEATEYALLAFGSALLRQKNGLDDPDSRAP